METIRTLYEREPAPASTLPPELAAAYDGGLVVPDGQPGERPYVLVNFIESLDGVISYTQPGEPFQGTVGGKSDIDHMVMGILRARADAVIFGAGSLREDKGHIHTPAFVSPPHAEAYAAMRAALGKGETQPLSVVMSASGQIDLDERTFHAPGLRVIVATTAVGKERLRGEALPAGVEVRAVDSAMDGAEAVDVLAMLRLLAEDYGVRVALNEGGPLVLASFLAAGAVDELFLTLAPQLAGRTGERPRRALVEGVAFSPADAPNARILSVKQAGDHLFLRYGIGK
ncbi:MAG TPA: dihydrofolate reductase family protein [Ktedonobacterales bacterium]|nr:dihydrofolate reductase family protein [Ktedonobacterales bacterium]